MDIFERLRIRLINTFTDKKLISENEIRDVYFDYIPDLIETAATLKAKLKMTLKELDKKTQQGIGDEKKGIEDSAYRLKLGYDLVIGIKMVCHRQHDKVNNYTFPLLDENEVININEVGLVPIWLKKEDPEKLSKSAIRALEKTLDSGSREPIKRFIRGNLGISPNEIGHFWDTLNADKKVVIDELLKEYRKGPDTEDEKRLRSILADKISSGIEFLSDSVRFDTNITPEKLDQDQVEVKQPMNKKLDLDMENADRVFVVHGRNESIRIDFFNFLRAVGLSPIEWSQAVALTGEGAPFIGDIIDSAFNRAQAVVVLLTPDDKARLKEEYWTENDRDYEKELTGQPRPNVLFEAGMAFGRHPERTLLVTVGNPRPFSDISGRHRVRLDNDASKRLDIIERLDEAGCNVSKDGRDWMYVGDFST